MHAHLWELGCVVDGDGVGANVSDGAGVIVGEALGSGVFG